MPNGTVFPTLDGSAPGDTKDIGQDITDVPLEPLFEDSSVLSEPGSSQVSDFAPAPTEAAEVDISPTASDRPAPFKSPVQARIDKLTRRAYERERETITLQNQLAAVTQALEAANARNAQLIAPRPLPQNPSGQSSNPFESQGNQSTVPATNFDEGRIAEILDRRLAPIAETLQARSEAEKLRIAHEQSFQETIREYPELARPDSEFRQHFNEVFDKSPLKALPDAPYQIALQVRGLLSDVRKDRQVTAARKSQAGVSVPSQPNPEGAGRSEVNGLPSDVWQAYTKNKEKLRAGTATQADRMQVLRVNQFLSQRKI